jgi:hypothetical protein
MFFLLAASRMYLINREYIADSNVLRLDPSSLKCGSISCVTIFTVTGVGSFGVNK